MAVRNRDEIIAKIRNRQIFQAGALSGVVGGGLPPGHGMPAEHAGQYEADLSDREVAYTVLSYLTPIAWVLNDGTVRVPPHRYSVTTGAHQGVAREALGVPRP